MFCNICNMFEENQKKMPSYLSSLPLFDTFKIFSEANMRTSIQDFIDIVVHQDGYAIAVLCSARRGTNFATKV